MKKRIAALISAAFIASTSAFAETRYLTQLPEFSSPDIRYEMLDNLIDIYVENHIYDFTREEVMEKLVKDLLSDHPEYINMLINTMLGTMDPYSSLHEKDSGYLNTKASTEYGITVSDTGEAIIIQRVNKGSNAEIAGLKANDRIISAAGIDVSEMPLNALMNILSEPYIYVSEPDENGKYPETNPYIDITVERDGEEITVTMQKGKSAQSELRITHDDETQTAFISISQFIDENLADDFKEVIEEISGAGTKNIIIDLRNNGGGYLELALRMSEIFADENELMCYTNRKDFESPMPIISATPGIKFDKIVVLTNKYTASAAELMSSILRDTAGAIIIGEKTYGKGIGQTVIPLVTGDTISISTYEVLNAKGESYNNIGLYPDIQIKNVSTLFDMPELKELPGSGVPKIKPGIFSEECLAIEQRLEIAGLIREESVDGIWDETTKNAVMILQRIYTKKGNGTLDKNVISILNSIISSYEYYVYSDDSQSDVANAYISSGILAAKKLAAERVRLADVQKEKITANEVYFEELYSE